MCKKLGVTALAIVAALFVLHKLDLLGYVKSAAKHAREDIGANISPEMKVQRLKDEVASLPAELNKQRNAIAKESTQIDVLKDEIAKAKVNLKDREEKLTALRTALKSENDFVTLDGDKLPKEKVEAVFARKFAEFQAAESAVKAKEDLLSHRKEKLDVAIGHLRTMESKYKEMQSKVELMEIELAKLRDAQMQNNFSVDDSRFSDVQKLYDDVNQQISTQKKALQMQTAADVDAAVEKAIDQKVEVKKAVDQWDARVSANGSSTEKVSKKE
jgi:chromosome segregation ATPase